MANQCVQGRAIARPQISNCLWQVVNGNVQVRAQLIPPDSPQAEAFNDLSSRFTHGTLAPVLPSR